MMDVFAPTKILVPTDFSEHSDLALSEAIEIAKTFSAKVFVLHVVDEFLQQCAIDYCLDTEVIQQISKGAMKTARVKIRKQVERASGSKGVVLNLDTKLGDPYVEILKFQKKNDIDLIVTAPNGKRGILKNLIGSVAERLVHSSACSVLIVRNDR